MSILYVLDEQGNPQKTVNISYWSKWFENSDRHVAKDHIGCTEVSTVFLGIDHSHGRGEPLLYETMIFGGRRDGYQNRYTTREQALKGHAEAVAIVNLADISNEELEKMLFSSVPIRKWDFEKHEYQSAENKYGAVLVTEPFNADEIIRCTNCGKEITAGESMTSKQWHNEFGFGFPVCIECHQIEWGKYRAEKEKNKANE